MSRIGNMPVPLPSGVDVDIQGSDVTVKGARGVLTYSFHPDMAIARNNGAVWSNARRTKGITARCTGLRAACSPIWSRV